MGITDFENMKVSCVQNFSLSLCNSANCLTPTSSSPNPISVHGVIIFPVPQAHRRLLPSPLIPTKILRTVSSSSGFLHFYFLNLYCLIPRTLHQLPTISLSKRGLQIQGVCFQAVTFQLLMYSETFFGSLLFTRQSKLLSLGFKALHKFSPATIPHHHHHSST